jgi:hypothetical protein
MDLRQDRGGAGIMSVKFFVAYLVSVLVVIMIGEAIINAQQYSDSGFAVGFLVGAAWGILLGQPLLKRTFSDEESDK